ncbi:unnamed protein product [Zymoseptoria tritici ST99CH_3D1]|nr:unnamed protein product [Zymoseptoria tritici ST99CH_3D1]
MSSNRNIGRLGLSGLSGMFTTLAAGLRGDASDALLLTPDQVCRQTLAILRSASPLLEWSIRNCLPIVLLGVGLSQYVNGLLQLRCLGKQVYSNFLSSVTVAGLSPLNKEACSYIAKHGIGQDSRSLTLSENDSENSDLPLAFIPAVSSASWFKFNGVWLKFSRNRNDDEKPEKMVNSRKYGTRMVGGEKADPDIILSCFSFTGSVKPIKDFLEHVQAATEAENALMISITRWSADSRLGARGEFDPITVHRPARNLDSVSMEAAKKASMVTDMTTYLASQKWYADRGIPRRRGYCLYGPPGTGKTSIACALAGHFGIALIIISLSTPGMSDASLQMMFDALPTRCIVLLEDIDSAGIKRERVAEPADDDQAGRHYGVYRQSPPNPANVTLSGLLNAIDGVGAHEGRILLATTNSPDSLDPALVRPGRIDMKILFAYASAEVSESLFLHIFQDTEGRTPHHGLAALANKFSALIPEDQLSPAEVQNFLLAHRNDPEEAVEGAAAWAESMLETRRQGGNVASFNGQI